MEKPISCESCPVCRKDKKEIWCGCLGKLRAPIQDSIAQLSMYKKCPLDWQEPTKKEQIAKKLGIDVK